MPCRHYTQVIVLTYWQAKLPSLVKNSLQRGIYYISTYATGGKMGWGRDIKEILNEWRYSTEILEKKQKNTE